MKLTPYKRILTMAKEKIQESLAPIRALEMRKKAELEQCQIDGKMAELEAKISAFCAEYPINFDKLIDAMDERALLERRREQFGDIIKQMFPE